MWGLWSGTSSTKSSSVSRNILTIGGHLSKATSSWLLLWHLEVLLLVTVINLSWIKAIGVRVWLRVELLHILHWILRLILIWIKWVEFTLVGSKLVHLLAIVVIHMLLILILPLNSTLVILVVVLVLPIVVEVVILLTSSIIVIFLATISILVLMSVVVSVVLVVMSAIIGAKVIILELLSRMELFCLLSDLHCDSISSFLMIFVFVVIYVFFPLSFLVLELLDGVVVSFPLLLLLSIFIFLIFSLLIFTLFEIIVLLSFVFRFFSLFVISDDLLDQRSHHCRLFCSRLLKVNNLFFLIFNNTR